MKKLIFTLFVFTTLVLTAQISPNGNLTYHMSPEELARKHEIGKNRVITDPPPSPIMNIAEFQPMQGVVVRYPFGIPVSLIASMSNVVKVTTIISSSSQQTTVTNQYQSAGVNMDNIDFIIASTDSYWTRDYGPWFIIDGNNEFGIVDFVYNRPRPNDNLIPSVMANSLNINLYGMTMEHTGGNYMTDGYGISASTTLTIEENNMTVQQLQTMASDYLGIHTYHFIEDPLADYIEHIDCWGKFLAVDKVMIGQVAETDSRYQDYEDVANFFANTPTSWGYNYRVYRVYTPGNYSNTVPYTNSLILNDHVFVPQTGNQWDDEAITSYQEAMPGYTVVPVMQSNSTPWENTDALHCRTHEIADLGMLLIRHYPFYGEQIANLDYIINAEITAYSGQALVTDSILVYYRINDGEWQTLTMLQQCGTAWQAVISNVSEGSEVDYYIFAKDESGRREKHPYIGEYDPHTFTIPISDCQPPTDLLATPNDNSISLSWTASEGAVSYSIYRNSVFVTASTSTTWIDNNVQPNTEYCYMISAVCTNGNSNLTDPSCAIIIVETCNNPENLTTTTISSTIQLEWDAVDGAVSYSIYKDDILLNTVSSINYTDENVEPEVIYCYKVKAVCENNESDFSNESCASFVSINELSKSFKIFPNPSQGQLFIEGANIEKIAIYNIYGQFIESIIVNNAESTNINVTSYNNGIYVLQILISDGSKISKRVFIAK